VAIPTSAIDGYVYSRTELMYIWTFANTGPDASDNNDRMNLDAAFVDSTGNVTINSYRLRSGGNDTVLQHDGTLRVIVFAKRDAEHTYAVQAPVAPGVGDATGSDMLEIGQSPVSSPATVSNALTTGGALAQWQAANTSALPGVLKFDVLSVGGLVDILLFASSGGTGPNGYVFRYDGRNAQNAGQILIITNGTWANIGTAKAAANGSAQSGWHSIEARMSPGGTMDIFVDGVWQCSAVDNTYAPTGALYYGYEVVTGPVLAPPSLTQKTLDLLPDGTSFKRVPSAHFSGATLTKLTRLSDSTLVDGDSIVRNGIDPIDVLPNGTYAKTLATRVSAGKPLIDFSEGIHTNKNLDNIGDGPTFVRPTANQRDGGGRAFGAIDTNSDFLSTKYMRAAVGPRITTGGSNGLVGAGGTGTCGSVSSRTGQAQDTLTVNANVTSGFNGADDQFEFDITLSDGLGNTLTATRFFSGGASVAVTFTLTSTFKGRLVTASGAGTNFASNKAATFSLSLPDAFPTLGA
jgi:hypothetical protein